MDRFIAMEATLQKRGKCRGLPGLCSGNSDVILYPAPLGLCKVVWLICHDYMLSYDKSRVNSKMRGNFTPAYLTIQ